MRNLLRWPLLVGLLSLAATAGLWRHEQESQQRHLRGSFDFSLRQTATRIEQRMAGYEQMLRGARGLFEASDEVTPADFAGYVDSLLAGADFAGLRNMAYVPLQAPGGPAQPVYVAPEIGGGLQALSQDLWSHPLCRAAMLHARNSGGVAITQRLWFADGAGVLAETPAGAGAGGAPGFLMFMPVYQRGRPATTALQRQANLAGWVVAAFRMDDLMASLYGEGTPGLDVRIHDGTEVNEGTRIHPAAPPASQPARFESQEYLGFAGHIWTVVVRSGPEFEERFANDAAQVIAISGTGLSAVLTLLAWLLVTGRERAHDTARAMTQELRESAERYRRIVETADEGIWTVDAQGRTSFVNPKLQRMLGYDESQMLGRPWTDFMAAGEAASALGSTRDDAGKPELRLRRRDGSALWATLATSPITDAAGRNVGTLAMVTDISERQLAEARRAALEAQLRQSQKMEAIGTLAGGIAHDFNNVLAAILGNVALLQQDGAATTEDDAARLEQIGKAATRARSLVQQIVAFSRQQPQQLQAQPLKPLMQETLALLRSTMPAGVDLQTRLSDEPLWVSADATQLQQVLMNLCTNAWHALPGGAGHIEVGLDTRTLSAEAADTQGLQPGPHAHVWVADNGIGMDDATRQRVFEPFFTTKPVGRGTGLGLAVVHGIVALHRGAIGVRSAPGQGSRFEILLPLTTARSDAAPAPPAEVPQGHGERLLYVDDDPVMGLMVQALLTRQGYAVQCLTDPREAQKLLHDPLWRCDLLVTDFNMPELSGLDLARSAALRRPALPVIISSGFVSDALRSEAQSAGVMHLLQKEYTLEQLPALVQRTLAEHAASGPPAAP